MEEREFDFCGKTDLHAIGNNEPLDGIVAIAAEHGFRGIVVQPIDIEELVMYINNPVFGDKQILPIAMLDYPWGNSTSDVRAYCISSMKEKGAKEVEIVAPYNYLSFAQPDLKSVENDIKNIANAAKRVNIGLKYVIDQNCPYVTDEVRNRLAKILAANKLQMVSVSSGFFDKTSDDSDIIMSMRTVKNKSGLITKSFIKYADKDTVASFVKAGVDLIGLDWRKAPNVVHGYEKMIYRKE